MLPNDAGKIAVTGTEEIEIFGNRQAGKKFVDFLSNSRIMFAFVMAYTDTCRIPGITIAGASPEMIKYTPPADAEFIQYGSCKSIDFAPATPDGKPTPALLTRVALASAGIPFLAINAGGIIRPQMPFIEAGISHGNDISREPGLSAQQMREAIERGRETGEMLASLTDCIVIGESIPGGTTTAQAVMQGLGINARSSSSMPQNPTRIKNAIIQDALTRLQPGDDLDRIAQLADPMIPFVAGMLSTVSQKCGVMLAGGTQMAAVLAVAKILGFDRTHTALGTTRYIVEDQTANLTDIVPDIAPDIPILSIDPGLDSSDIPGLQAFSEGFAKEGAGAGGSIISAIARSDATVSKLRRMAEAEYARVWS